jgi:molybdate transport system substrate-binding protein
MSRAAASLLALLLTALCSLAVAAEEITVLCPRGVQAPLAAVAERFRAEHGHRVRFEYGTAGAVARRASAGEAADIVITAARGLDDLGARGVTVSTTRVSVGAVGVGIAVRAGAARPDVATPEALTAALLGAPSIGYADPARGGQGGTHFAKVIAQLGLTEKLRPKTRLFPEGLQALERVAAGEVALAAAPISEILPLAGLSLAGPLPSSLQARLAYAAALLARAPAPDVARAFLAALTAPGSREILTRGGVEPD